VRIWYNDVAASADGSPLTTSMPTASSAQLDGVPTYSSDGNGLRAQFRAVRDMLAVVAIVDVTKVAGFDWAQVTDYIAMAGLTKIDLDGGSGDTPSILRLFNAPPDSRPQSLSEWDRAFLQGLYHTDARSRHQRTAVSHVMVQHLTR
jgi:hypothetical protein